MKVKPILKSIIILLAGIYLYSVGKNPLEHYFIHTIHLIFHEAGHFIFIFFGQFIHMAGGTLLQLIIPIFLALYFLLIKKDIYAFCFMLLWLGSSFFDVAIYAKDAIVMNLDLLGGDNVTHDWNYLLSTLGLLKYTYSIAGIIYSLGTLSIITGVVIGIYNSFIKEEIDTV